MPHLANFAIESEQDTPFISDGETGLVTDPDAEAGDETALEDAEALLDNADEAIETTGQLETIRTVLQTTEDTGATPVTAELATIATEALCRRLGYNAREVVPALEHFSSHHTCQTATRISVEGLGDVIKNIWKAIVNAFKRVWEVISSIFSSIFERGQQEREKRLRQSIESDVRKLKKEGKKRPSSLDENNDYVRQFNLISAFSIPGVKPSSQNVEIILNNTIELIKELNKEISSEAELIKDITAFIDKLSATYQQASTTVDQTAMMADFLAMNKKYADKQFTSFQPIQNALNDSEHESFQDVLRRPNTLVSKPMLNGRRYVFFSQIETHDNHDYITVDFKTVHPKKLVNDVDMLKFPYPEIHQVEEIQRQLSVLDNTMNDVKQHWKNKGEKEYLKLLDKIKDLIRDIDHTANQKPEAAKITRMFSRMLHSQIKVNVFGTGIFVTTANETLVKARQLCEVTVKYYQNLKVEA